MKENAAFESEDVFTINNQNNHPIKNDNSAVVTAPGGNASNNAENRTYNSRIGTEQSAALNKDENLLNARRIYDASNRRYVVFICCFLLHFVAGGLNASLSVIFVDIVQAFDSSRSEASLMQSVSRGIMFGGGIMAEVLIRKLGMIQCLFFGGVTLTGCLFASQFAEHMLTLVLLVGIGGGIGTLFPIQASTIAINQSFSNPAEAMKYLALMVSGGGVGFIIMPYICELILEEYGWRGTLMVLSAIFAHVFVSSFGLIYYLPPRYASQVLVDPTKNVRKNKCDFRIFKSPMYVTFLIAVIPFGMIGFIEVWYLSDFVVSLGYTRQQGVILITVTGISDFCGRICAGLITCVCQRTKTFFISHWIYIQALFGISHLLCILFPVYEAMFGASILYGFIFGIIFSQCAPIILEAVGTSDFAFAQGVQNTIYGISTTVGGAFAGYISDTYGGYDMVFFLGFLLNCFASVPCLLLLLYNAFKKRKNSINPSTSTEQNRNVITI